MSDQSMEKAGGGGVAGKRKWPLIRARKLAEKIAAELEPKCERIQIAGSIRREKEMVGDVEILLIPKIREQKSAVDLFKRMERIDEAAEMINGWVHLEKLRVRQKRDGTTTWGPFIRLATAVETGIPIDFFWASHRNWWNYLVCRTGSAEHNIKVCLRARQMGWNWHPTENGFTRKTQHGAVEWREISSEEDLFQFLGWPYKEPQERK